MLSAANINHQFTTQLLAGTHYLLSPQTHAAKNSKQVFSLIVRENSISV